MLCESPLSSDDNIIDIIVTEKGFCLFKELESLGESVKFDSKDKRKELCKIVRSNNDQKVVSLALKILNLILEDHDKDRLFINFLFDPPNKTWFLDIILEYVDVNSRNDEGYTILFHTVLLGENYLEYIKRLIERGADCNVKSIGSNSSILSQAAFYNKLDYLDLLIKAGVDVNTQNKHGDAPLIFASYKGNLDVVNKLIEAGADVNAKNQYGETSLIFASCKGYIDVVNRLIEAGVDVNAKNQYGNTSLIWASDKGHFDVVKKLIEAGADVDTQNNDEQTALCLSLKHFDIVKVLLANGAKIGDALYQALSKDNIKSAKELLRYAEDFDLLASKDQIPLIQLTNNYEIVKELIMRGASDVSKCRGVESPLILAIENDDLYLVKLILMKNIDINEIYKCGKTALHLAILKGNEHDVKLHLLPADI